ncbi:autotransporter outer membrane beta-barrel domain-containing protein [Serratia bockelmannii]|nr:autotransporter serine protease [Serratia bockelmannii]MCW7649158.1 autotransporter outer membrane beta-barrel domain-containing protein [Serratia bockelmannii]MCW7659207.1 autotransporter outer membrane beta-barrel domain-containing protein [Serratia bockelmannii]MCW7678991.1 autotransporter outer membrane beta-barrel domain-containing protein [Serratia bockelmannii]MCW7683768.1 autotransporter outer membrane beta-barrel domain-containing protein [Serratia bockelmannii]MCW7688545.1 autotra
MFPVSVFASEAGYVEAGRTGVPISWMSGEFNRQWGLEAINAQDAYASGFNGQGVTIGVFDEKTFFHPEFAGKINIISDYLPYDFDVDESDEEEAGVNISFGSHGTHVAGIAAARRDGVGMHGVAFGASLITGSMPGEHNQMEYMAQSPARVINNSWGDTPEIERDENGNEIYLNSGFPKYEQVKFMSIMEDLLPLKSEIDARSQTPTPWANGNKEARVANYAGMLRLARSGKLIVFAAGNSNNYNIPMSDESIPYLFPEVLGNYLTVTNLGRNDDLDASSTRCAQTASYCVSAPGDDIYSTSGYFVSLSDGPVTKEALDNNELDVEPQYEKMSGTSMSAPLVSGAAAVLMSRFPYMTAEQISIVLKTTATDLGTLGIDERFGWGKINLQEAIGGPKMFVTAQDIPEDLYVPGSYTQRQFVANIVGMGAIVEAGTSNERVCDAVECGVDSWTNNITGHGGLTKEGMGTLVMTGANTYSGPTLVNQGRLAINGSVTSAVTVQNAGILGGSGSVGSLTARRGGTVAPGNSIGTLNVANNINFEPGSRYAVEVAPNSQSDRIHSGGSATITGGEVAVSLENSSNLLSQSEVRSLLGQQYNILTAVQGVSGQFDAVAPNYLFLGAGLSYQPNQVALNVGRNDTSFGSVAQTQNERAVAAAADEVAAGNPVYESILNAGSVGEARQAFRQLSGQIHADIASALVNDSRYLREALNGRLRQAEGLASSSAIKADEDGAWAQLLGAWDHASGDANATGYQASTYGVLVGLDSALADDGRLGVATGYTRTSLDGGYGSNADSDNYHLAAYGDKQFGALALRGGVGYTWHRIDTKRSVNYGMQSDRDTAKYSARTEQLFAEAGYSVKGEWLNLEPFVNLEYVNFENNGIAESGGAAALRGDKQHTDATVSTLGLRADTSWQVSLGSTVALRSELGWQHQYGGLERGTGLRFNGGNAPFVVDSVPVSRDGMVLKAGAEVAVNENASLSLGYGGLLSQHHQDNSINAGFTWRF